MGINIRDYVIYGRKLPWDDDFMELSHDTVDVIDEGMDCETIFVGPVLWRSEDYRWCDGDGDGLVEIDIQSLPTLEAEYKKKFIEAFPEYKEWMVGPFTLYAFTRYS